jgi:hypothetical protein
VHCRALSKRTIRSALKADGALRIKIDGNTSTTTSTSRASGEVFTIDVEELSGRYLVFEAATDDEVEISDISVLYARERRRIPRDRDNDHDRWQRRRSSRRRTSVIAGWRAYPRAAGCIGGDECRKNGNRITIPLEDAPVLGVRFYAKDDIGTRADGKLTVRIDDTQVGWYIDVQRAGKRHELDVENVYGQQAHHRDRERRRGRHPRHRSAVRTRRSRRRRRLRGGRARSRMKAAASAAMNAAARARASASISTAARWNRSASTRATTSARAPAASCASASTTRVLSYSIDIPREGKTFTIDGKNMAGEYLIIEPAEDDEVVIKDVRVTFTSFQP